MSEEVEKLKGIIQHQKQVIEFQLKIVRSLMEDRKEFRSNLINELEAMENKYPDEMGELAERLGINPDSEILFFEIAHELILRQKEFNPKFGNDEIRALIVEGAKEHYPSISDADAYELYSKAIIEQYPEILEKLPVLGTNHTEDTLKPSISRGRKKLEKLRSRYRN